MQRSIELPSRPSFLQKFQGRNHRINREGLLQLLFAKRQSIGEKNTKMQGPGLRLEIGQLPGKLVKSTSSQKHLKGEKKVFSSQQSRENNGSRSEACLNRRVFSLSNQENQGAASSRLKLPLLRPAPFAAKPQMLESDRPSRQQCKSGPFYSKRAARQVQVDEYVLRHLQFLGKFQRQFMDPPCQSSRG